MLKPICVPCGRFYRPKKNEYYFIEGMPAKDGAAPGREHPDDWRPYKLWCGDLWECEGCATQIIVGVGSRPVSEHYMPEFKKCMEQLNADQLQVNDC